MILCLRLTAPSQQTFHSNGLLLHDWRATTQLHREAATTTIPNLATSLPALSPDASFMAGIWGNTIAPSYTKMTHASMKRAHATDNEERGLHDAKRQKIIRHHRIKHRQPFHEDPTLAPQDEAFFQSQLLRAISLNLSAVGFDGVKPTALEAFRAEVNECT